jgi:hypothetical protein
MLVAGSTPVFFGIGSEWQRKELEMFEAQLE